MLYYLPYFLIAYLSIIPTSILADQQSSQPQKKVVLSSFSIIEDIAKNIAKDLVIVESLVQSGIDIHSYQATPSDVIKIQNADLILCNGLHLEESFMKYFTNFKQDTKIVTVTDGINPIGISKNVSAIKEPNPHAWMSLSNAMIYIKNIRDALQELDPKNAEAYKRNAEEYAKKIESVILPLKAKLNSIDSKNRWLVTSEGCLVYLAADMGFKYLYIWPVNSDTERMPSRIRTVIDQMRKNKIKFIFSESTNSDLPAKQIAYETNSSYGGVLYIDTLSNQYGPAPTYLDMLKVTLTTITDCLSK